MLRPDTLAAMENAATKLDEALTRGAHPETDPAHARHFWETAARLRHILTAVETQLINQTWQ